MSPSEMKDLMRNTHFKEKELRDWYSGFIKDCPDGLLNKEQFIDLYSSFYGSENAKRFASHVFRTFDKNKDGQIGTCYFVFQRMLASKRLIDGMCPVVNGLCVGLAGMCPLINGRCPVMTGTCPVITGLCPGINGFKPRSCGLAD